LGCWTLGNPVVGTGFNHDRRQNKEISKVLQKGKRIMKNVTLNPINSANSANRNSINQVNENKNLKEESKMTSNNNKPNTLGELQAQISDAGNHLVWNIIHKVNGTYETKWFNAEAIIANRDKAILDAIDQANKTISNAFELEESYGGLYDDIIVVDCDNIRAAVKAVYGDQDKYGDINPFIDYCYICCGFETRIDIFEYEKIREFFEG
jgi:hypothetical protein